MSADETSDRPSITLGRRNALAAVGLGSAAALVGGSPASAQALPDATPTQKGVLRLAQDLAGNADSPTVVKLTGASGVVPTNAVLAVTKASGGSVFVGTVTGDTQPRIELSHASGIPQLRLGPGASTVYDVRLRRSGAAAATLDGGGSGNPLALSMATKSRFTIDSNGALADGTIFRVRDGKRLRIYTNSTDDTTANPIVRVSRRAKIKVVKAFTSSFGQGATTITLGTPLPGTTRYLTPQDIGRPVAAYDSQGNLLPGLAAGTTVAAVRWTAH